MQACPGPFFRFAHVWYYAGLREKAKSNASGGQGINPLHPRFANAPTLRSSGTSHLLTGIQASHSPETARLLYRSGRNNSGQRLVGNGARSAPYGRRRWIRLGLCRMGTDITAHAGGLVPGIRSLLIIIVAGTPMKDGHASRFAHPTWPWTCV